MVEMAEAEWIGIYKELTYGPWNSVGRTEGRLCRMAASLQNPRQPQRLNKFVTFPTSGYHRQKNINFTGIKRTAIVDERKI
jgi:hypothetical protein